MASSRQSLLQMPQLADASAQLADAVVYAAASGAWTP